MFQRLVVLVGLALALIACGPDPVPLSNAGETAAGKAFAPPAPGMAALYVDHPTRAGLVFSVTAGARMLGSLSPHTWLRVELPPGRVDLRATAASLDKVAGIVLDLAPDQIRFIQVGLDASNSVIYIREISGALGRQGVLSGQRALELR